ncbi:MAG: HD-GYP domain-containing protein [Planctomycetota bacterium]|jgi:putative nucleotidyltransferase with HDIG domain
MDPEVLNALLKVQRSDTETAAHTWRVSLYTLALAEAAGADRALRARLMRAAVLHDIGKIDIPSEIIAKPGRLTDEEYEVVKTHTRLGYQRLVRLGENDELILDVVRWHHERLDGSGYPDALVGDRIPQAARWFAIIDSFDAMTSLRPYRRTVGEQAASLAIEELQAHAGSWYCPESLDIFVRVYQSGELNWILHHLNDEQSLIELPPAPDDEALGEARQRIEDAIARITDQWH